MTRVPFDPDSDAAVRARDRAITRRGERYVRYIYDQDLILAIEAARVTDRPLLLRGEPGSGKSTLARDVALVLGHRYYEHTVTSRMQARDVLYQFDAVRRLATVRETDTAEEWRFVTPGRLWWAFDPSTAARRGRGPTPELEDPTWGAGAGPGAVLLIDEIDKADPDVPNDLLIPLGEKRFHVDEIGRDVVQAQNHEVLVFVTTNGERDLPQAFLRRCIVVDLDVPTGDQRKRIVLAHFPAISDEIEERVTKQFEHLSQLAQERGLRRPGTAELLDALRACTELSLTPEQLEVVVRATAWKHDKLQRKESSAP
jgi:MoxR-like ATPase